MKNKSIVTGCPALLYTLLGPPISVRQACRLRGSMLSYNMRRERIVIFAAFCGLIKLILAALPESAILASFCRVLPAGFRGCLVAFV